MSTIITMRYVTLTSYSQEPKNYMIVIQVHSIDGKLIAYDFKGDVNVCEMPELLPVTPVSDEEDFPGRISSPEVIFTITCNASCEGKTVEEPWPSKFHHSHTVFETISVFGLNPEIRTITHFSFKSLQDRSTPGWSRNPASLYPLPLKSCSFNVTGADAVYLEHLAGAESEYGQGHQLIGNKRLVAWECRDFMDVYKPMVRSVVYSTLKNDEDRYKLGLLFEGYNIRNYSFCTMSGRLSLLDATRSEVRIIDLVPPLKRRWQ
jgi:hypothetical protein